MVAIQHRRNWAVGHLKTKQCKNINDIKLLVILYSYRAWAPMAVDHSQRCIQNYLAEFDLNGAHICKTLGFCMLGIDLFAIRTGGTCFIMRRHISYVFRWCSGYVPSAWQLYFYKIQYINHTKIGRLSIMYSPLLTLLKII